jgi:hypothetical protein
MQFLMLIRIANDGDYEAGKPLPPALDVAMGELIGEWTQAGAMVTASGLKPPSQGARVRLGRGKVTVTDGPFTEAKEVVGGFFVLEAADRAAAVGMTADRAAAVGMTERFVEIHRRVLGDDFVLECEVRQIDA